MPPPTLPRPLMTLRLARAYALSQIARQWDLRDETQVVLTMALPAALRLDPDVVALLAEVPIDTMAHRLQSCWETGEHDPVAETLTWRLRDGPERRSVHWELRIFVEQTDGWPPAAWAVVYDPVQGRQALGSGEDNGLLQWDARRENVNHAYGRSSGMTRVL
jgi:hypothetical protein